MLEWVQDILILKIFNTSSHIYRVIRKSVRDFRPLRYSSRYGHAEGEHVNRGRETPIFFPTVQVRDRSTLGDTTDVNPVIKILPSRCTVWQELDYRIDICRVTKGGPIAHLYGRKETWSLSPSVDMLPFGVTVPATVPQRSEIPDRLTNYSVLEQRFNL